MNALLKTAILASEEREMLRKSWGWFVGLGAFFVVLGVVGLIFVGFTTLLTVLFIGWAFLIGGVAEVIHAILRKGWSGFWLDLISGVVTAMVGMFIILHPVGSAGVLTIVIGLVFLIGGIFRIGAGVATRNPYAGWFVLHGVVSVILGSLVLAGWPVDSLWVIGTLVAIDLLINGLRLISFGFAARHLPTIGGDDERTPAPAPTG